MRNSPSYGGLLKRNSASCGTPHAIFRKGLKAFAEKSQYSASMRNSALDFRYLRSIGTNFPLHAELCSIGIFAELRKMWKSNGEFSASNIFHFFLNLFHYIFRMMRKCSPNTPQEIFASKLAENEGFCGNLRYGNPHPIPIPTPTLPYLASLYFKRKFYLAWNHSIKATGTVRVFHSVTSEGFSAPEWG